MRAPPPERCLALNRVSQLTAATVNYARNNHELCGISGPLLNQVEQYQYEVAEARDNVCAGRPLRPFPPDVVPH